VIDDELLQELLAKASGLYNNGDYRGAISAWKEALAADPSSQKAREGIQMATLLLGDWDPQTEPADAADGAHPSHPRLTPDERAARLDEGVARVRTLLRQRQYSAAIEGARSLVPIDPDSDEVQRLVEEAQQAFESAPFIEEHLVLARELAAQERLSEAEAECRKVFALDPANPDAQALAAALRARMEAPEGAAGAGGVTMRMEIADLMAAQERAAAPGGPPENEAPAPAEEPAPGMQTDAAIAASLPDDLMEVDFETSGGEAPEPEAPEAMSEPIQDLTPEPAPEAAHEAASASDPGALELDLPSTGGPAPGGAAEEILDAETVVPPAVRLVPRTGAESESVEAFLEKTEDVVSVPMAPPAGVAPPSPFAKPAEPIGWEDELESLNLKTGEHDIVGRSASLNTTPATPSGGEMDLASLLGDDNDDLGGKPEVVRSSTDAAGPPPAPRPHEESPLDDLASGLADEMIGGLRDNDEAGTAMPAVAPEPELHRVPNAPPRQRPRLSVPPTMFAVLGVVILAGAGVVWWFVYQPKTAAAQVSAPPAGNPPADRAAGEGGGRPIPTPLGSTSRQPAPPAGSDASVAAVAAMPHAPETGPGAAPSETHAAVEPPPAPAPAPPRPSPEELRREATRHLADGRRLMAAQKWQEARTELAAALALDPVNFECKEMLDQVQSKVDEEVKVTRELDEARRAFADKDYQGCLWKLYRLPRDPRLGDIDVYIRNAWFNWAVVGLKGGDATDARQKLTEVLTADPGDADAKKMLDVAERYASRAKDRVFYSFTDTLRFRAFDQK